MIPQPSQACHFVFLVSKEDFQKLPSWLTDNFVIGNGGVHNGGHSQNQNIAFKDGTYIELYSWIGEPPADNDWAPRLPGLIDFALTTTWMSAEDNFRSLQHRLDHGGDGRLGVGYMPPMAGGRKRKDGVEVIWEATDAEYSQCRNTPGAEFHPIGRSDVPFWCHDITPREWRVPYKSREWTDHPCRAVGVDYVEVLVPHHAEKEYATLYGNALNVDPEYCMMGHKHIEEGCGTVFRINLPGEDVRRSAFLWLHAPRDREEHDWLRTKGISFCGLGIRVDISEGHGCKDLHPGSRIKLIW